MFVCLKIFIPTYHFHFFFCLPFVQDDFCHFPFEHCCCMLETQIFGPLLISFLLVVRLDVAVLFTDPYCVSLLLLLLSVLLTAASCLASLLPEELSDVLFLIFLRLCDKSVLQFFIVPQFHGLELFP